MSTITATDMSAFANIIFISMYPANRRNASVRRSVVTLASTKAVISFIKFFKLKFLDSNTKILFVTKAKATATTQAEVFAAISFRPVT